MIDSRITIDIRAVLLELKLSMQQLEEANVLNPLNPVHHSSKELAFMNGPELLTESYSRDLNIASYSR
jgi:hypothetical protein